MSEYRVALRHTTLLESAVLEAQGNDRYFIATAAPPPTNSILTLHQSEDGEEAPQFFLVDKVYEVEGDDQVCGVLGKLTDAEAHEAASMMGTEHLEDGQAPPEDHTLAMAMPAPVVDPDLDDGEPDARERDRLEAEVDGEESDLGADASATDDDQGDTSDGEGGSKRGRRRGRKRR